MKAWRTVAIAVLALTAVALVTTTALAYNARGTSMSYGNYGVAQGSGSGMMNGYTGGMMGWGYSQNGNYTYPNGSSQQSHGSWMYGSHYGGCGIGNCCP